MGEWAGAEIIFPPQISWQRAISKRTRSMHNPYWRATASVNAFTRVRVACKEFVGAGVVSSLVAQRPRGFPFLGNAARSEHARHAVDGDVGSYQGGFPGGLRIEAGSGGQS